jgi:hypothetical protein
MIAMGGGLLLGDDSVSARLFLRSTRAAKKIVGLVPGVTLLKKILIIINVSDSTYLRSANAIGRLGKSPAIRIIT